MAKQVDDDNLTFMTENEAHIHGIARYGSASENQPCGWSIKEIQELKLFVWPEFDPDYIAGLAFAIAETEEDAKRIVKLRYMNVGEWGQVTVHSLKHKHSYQRMGSS